MPTSLPAICPLAPQCADATLFVQITAVASHLLLLLGLAAIVIDLLKPRRTL